MPPVTRLERLVDKIEHDPEGLIKTIAKNPKSATFRDKKLHLTLLEILASCEQVELLDQICPLVSIRKPDHDMLYDIAKNTKNENLQKSIRSIRLYHPPKRRITSPIQRTPPKKKLRLDPEQIEFIVSMGFRREDVLAIMYQIELKKFKKEHVMLELRKTQRILPPPVETCKICFVNEIDTVLFPCGHLLTCSSCLQNYRKKHQRCPLCNTPLKATNKVFRT